MYAKSQTKMNMNELWILVICAIAIAVTTSNLPLTMHKCKVKLKFPELKVYMDISNSHFLCRYLASSFFIGLPKNITEFYLPVAGLRNKIELSYNFSCSFWVFIYF